MEKRKEDRFNTRLMVKLRSGVLKTWGVLKDVSENGLLVKSNHKFNPEASIDIEVIMADGETATISGIVKRIMVTPNENRKFGIGIEVIEKNLLYRNLVNQISNKKRHSEIGSNTLDRRKQKLSQVPNKEKTQIIH
jgi:hypothetical protein